MNKKRHTALYIFCDLVSAIIAWTVFFYLRNHYVDAYYSEYPEFRKLIALDINYQYGVIVVPLMWIALYYVSGYYKNIYRKSRLKEFLLTFGITILGSLILFFSIVLNDNVPNYKGYYESLWLLLSTQFIISYLPRLIITSRTAHKIQSREIGFNTLLIGSNEKAENLYKKLIGAKKSAGNKFIGFVNVIQQQQYQMAEYMPHLGRVEEARRFLSEYHVEEIIIAIESKEHAYIEHILSCIQGTKAVIKAIPDNCDIVSGRVSLESIHDEPLIVISQNVMPAWQEKVKRIMDVLVSLMVLIFAFPLYLFTAIMVKLSSKGPIFYKQERIGQYGIPFLIYKFRSMIVDSEVDGPQLSSEHDERITKWGRFMRKFRLDEIPQFFNVLKGDMSLVGPRPERQYFIDQIVKIAPHYTHLHKVRPGITSLGQVKYGYAQSPEEMASRMKYDIIYIENMSLYLDIKILIYTIKTVISGEGV
ncbi:MAG: sugar transferase [Bacteroidales bacterium]|nr:sugar transferase [Bacteroidales bacterium]